MDPVERLRALQTKSPHLLSATNRLGLLLARLALGDRRADARGNLIVERARGPVAWLLKFINQANRDVAMTIGNVIVNTGTFDESREYGARWLAHEDAHARQAEVLGIWYLPRYITQWLLSGGRHDSVPMEIEAAEYARRYWQEYLAQKGFQPL
jgi:hypothetical protein